MCDLAGVMNLTEQQPPRPEEFGRMVSLPHNHGWSAAAVAEALCLDPTDAEIIYRDIQSKREASRYRHTPSLLVEPIDEGRFRAQR